MGCPGALNLSVSICRPVRIFFALCHPCERCLHRANDLFWSWRSCGKTCLEVGPFSICGGTMFQGCFIGTRRILLGELDMELYGKNLAIV